MKFEILKKYKILHGIDYKVLAKCTSDKGNTAYVIEYLDSLNNDGYADYVGWCIDSIYSGGNSGGIDMAKTLSEGEVYLKKIRNFGLNQKINNKPKLIGVNHG